MADIDRFMAKVKKQPNGCWEWQGSKDYDGYGKFYNKDITGEIAHRWSYWYHKGNPTGMFVCHTCDNPSCVNPAHLWLGTAKDNTKDRNKKNRQAKEENNGNAKLSNADVYNIKHNLFGKLPVKLIAAQYNVSVQMIYNIKKEKHWANI